MVPSNYIDYVGSQTLEVQVKTGPAESQGWHGKTHGKLAKSRLQQGESPGKISLVKFTAYFLAMRSRSDRAIIQMNGFSGLLNTP
jgi:hypothetical protein